MNENQKRDYQKFFVAKGDPGFNPKRNEEIVDKTIKYNEELMKAKKAQYADTIRERADAVVSYLRSNAINSNKTIDKYLGRKGLAYMRGQQIVERIQRLKNGQTIITID